MADGPDQTQLGQVPARLIEALVECVHQLDVHTRTLVLLRYQQGFSFEEMAEICNDSAEALRARVIGALPRLNECIEARTGGKL